MFSFLDQTENLFERERREINAKVAKKKNHKNKLNPLTAWAHGLQFQNLLFSSVFFAFFALISRLSRSKILLVSAVLALPIASQAQFQNIGRPATPAEVKAWDIDVRPDFKGLPPGKGSVAQGEKLWELQCASCHGSFGESNEVFPPLAGFTTAKDVQTGRVAALQLNANAPTRTTLMKTAQLSTLWDYINRAMPWTAPKSLKADEVYAVTAYLLNLGNIVPADFTLSDQNIREVQQRMPNRNGLTVQHSLWPGTEFGAKAVWSKPDVQGSSCMKNCATDPKVASFIPEYARDAHGNLADQSRGFGPLRGAVTIKAAAAGKNVPNSPVVGIESARSAIKSGAESKDADLKASDVMPNLQKYACIACHGMDNKLVGPSFKEIAAKQSARADAQTYLAGKIKNGGQGVYGQIPMPAQSLSEAEAAQIARWLVQGAKP